MGFCVNLFIVDASFEMGPRWIFLADGFLWDRNLPHRGKLRQGKVLSFFEILPLFPYEMFSWMKFFIPDEKLSLPKRLPNKHVISLSDDM